MLPGSVERAGVASRRPCELAGEIGYPVMVKAVGGRRRARAWPWCRERGRASADAYRETRANAQALFGDGRRLRGAVPGRRARHVEIQVLCDRPWHTRFTWASETARSSGGIRSSIEETPAPGLSPERHARAMGEAAVRGAAAAGYVGAGTFEFLVDAERRLLLHGGELPHPGGAPGHRDGDRASTWCASRSASRPGSRWRSRQEDVRRAAPPSSAGSTPRTRTGDFAPAPGTLERVRAARRAVRPGGHPRLPGYADPAAYDSLLAKVIVWAPDREAALARMTRALAEFRVPGQACARPPTSCAKSSRTPCSAAAAHEHRVARAMMRKESSGTRWTAMAARPWD